MLNISDDLVLRVFHTNVVLLAFPWRYGSQLITHHKFNHLYMSTNSCMTSWSPFIALSLILLTTYWGMWNTTGPWRRALPTATHLVEPGRVSPTRACSMPNIPPLPRKNSWKAKTKVWVEKWESRCLVDGKSITTMLRYTQLAFKVYADWQQWRCHCRSCCKIDSRTWLQITAAIVCWQQTSQTWETDIKFGMSFCMTTKGPGCQVCCTVELA